MATSTKSSADAATLTKALIELSGLTAEIIRRSGASYGSAEDWRRDFTAAVEVTNSLMRASAVHNKCDCDSYRAFGECAHINEPSPSSDGSAKR